MNFHYGSRNSLASQEYFKTQLIWSEWLKKKKDNLLTYTDDNLPQH